MGPRRLSDGELSSQGNRCGGGYGEPGGKGGGRGSGNRGGGALQALLWQGGHRGAIGDDERGCQRRQLSNGGDPLDNCGPFARCSQQQAGVFGD